MHYFIGVDVGTSSVRAGLYNENGKLIKYVSKEIKIYNLKKDFYEQSSNNIWDSICYCTKSLLKSENLCADDILSIGFDATCSLVVLDNDSMPLSVSESKNNDINIIMWMDHRSKDQADFINSTKHDALKSVGGSISPEMDPPKILWLKENMYDECYKKAGFFYALPDFLFMKCTGINTVRSMCCVACKWLYKANENESFWDETFWSTIGLEDLTKNEFSKIGSDIRKPFSFQGKKKFNKKFFFF
jgi:D-ribulokinase